MTILECIKKENIIDDETIKIFFNNKYLEDLLNDEIWIEEDFED